MNMNTNVETTGLKCHHKTDKLCEIVLHKVAWNDTLLSIRKGTALEWDA